MMGPIITLLVLVGFVAIFVWFADWTITKPKIHMLNNQSRRERRPTALDILDQRLARGEIDKTEYDEKRKLIGR